MKGLKCIVYLEKEDKKELKENGEITTYVGDNEVLITLAED